MTESLGSGFTGSLLLGIQSLLLEVQGLLLGIQGLLCEVSGIRVQGLVPLTAPQQSSTLDQKTYSPIVVHGLGFRVQGLGFGV